MAIIGSRLGSYEIIATLGKGGMGEVYRARDTKLKREVAIKILPDEFSHDPDRVSRFQREAEILASLNHPNIAAIHSLEQANGLRFLVLELVEGETLADKLKRDSIEIEEALDIAKHICEALAAAHEKGVVHRDIKPTNVKITPDGKVKVLDFGLAKALEGPIAHSNISGAATLIDSFDATKAGVVLGTAAYMAPEQARAKDVDKRADIWAFGVVLYEMLTDSRPFQGEDVSDTLAAVLKSQPDWSALPASVSSSIRTLVRRCLEKDRRRRIADISTVLFVLDEQANVENLAAVGAPVPVLSQVVTAANGPADFDVSRDGTLVYVTGGVQPFASTLAWVDRQRHEEPLHAPARGYIYPRLSPDDTRIALDIRDQDNDIWLWDVARETLSRLTSNLALDRFPVWAPDGKHVIFSSDRTGMPNLYSQVIEGAEAAELLIQSPNRQFPTSVSPDGTRLVFALDKERRVQPLVQTPFDEKNGQISPDGRWLVYESDETRRFEIYVQPFPSLNSGHWQVSTGGGTQPLWSRNGQELLYLAPTGTLMSVQIGRGASWSASAPRKLIEGPYVHGNTLAAPTYDVSSDGRRFLMIKPAAEFQQATAPNLVVVQNWFEELKERVPVH